jgi:5-deoxy-D-glucuronate isomerase
MAKSKDNGGDLTDIANDVEDNGYEVFYVDTQYSQLYLSACAGPDRQWKLSKVADFEKNCGGW